MKETKTEKETPVEFDGYWEVKEPVEDGTYKTSRKKIWLSTQEQKKWLGDNDPNLYFRDGVIPNYCPKAFGTLLSEDREEVIQMRKAFPAYPEILMFKHDLQNIYTLLIPKKFSEHEINEDGDFVSRLVRYDTRSIPFTGGFNRPTAFQADYFNDKAALIKKHLDKAKKDRGL